MFSMVIQNPEIDPKAVTLVEEVFNAITTQWKELLPPHVKVVVTKTPLHRVKELGVFWSQQKFPRSSKEFVQVICPEYDTDEATVWVRYNPESFMRPREYYFKKELYEVLGGLIWDFSEDLRSVASTHATGLAAQKKGALSWAFRDSFSRFFLNPEWLQESKSDAWVFMSKIDQDLVGQKIG